VRAISVRSTEIETFDRASLIVPNSELITNVVTNWTHRNALGRVVIKVATSYKNDPARVVSVLTEVAKACPLVMQQPAPMITFDNFGAEGLEFSIRVLVADINRAMPVQTDIRTAVYRAFQQHGIDFPSAERNIYLRDLDGVKVLIARVLEERQRTAAHDAQSANARGARDPT
jgi:potassium-dependent mechanosensitive channel